MIRFSDAEDIRIECDERGFEMIFLTVDSEEVRVNVQEVAEQLYDRVKAEIGPWLKERDDAWAEFRQTLVLNHGGAFRCDPDESAGMREAYDLSDPKHPDFHSIHADIWDSREGK